MRESAFGSLAGCCRDVGAGMNPSSVRAVRAAAERQYFELCCRLCDIEAGSIEGVEMRWRHLS